MDILSWLSIIASVVSVTSAFINAWLYRRMSGSQIDDNIMNEVNSILILLEKVKKLDKPEQKLIVKLLNDWDYFEPPDFIKKRGRNIPKDETIEQLRDYFYNLGSSPDIKLPDKADDQSTTPEYNI